MNKLSPTQEGLVEFFVSAVALTFLILLGYFLYSRKTQMMGKELVGRLLMVVGCKEVYYWAWWGPLVAAPLIWQIFELFAFFFENRRMRKKMEESLSGKTVWPPAMNEIGPVQRLILDFISWGIYLAYIGFSVYLCGRNIGSWYGWLIGLAIGLFVAQLLGWLFPYRWHKEVMMGK